MKRSHLRLVPPAPTVPERRLLISSKARETEAKGERFYPRTHLEPTELPAAYRFLAAYPKRVAQVRAVVPSLIGVSLLVVVALLLIGLFV